jgi:hypothetical protein
MPMQRFMTCVAVCLLLLACVGCAQRNKAVLTGSQLSAPLNCWVSRKYHKTGKYGRDTGALFNVFDAQYPPGWPEALRFPRESYFNESGVAHYELVAPLGDGRTMYEFSQEGMCRGDQAAMLAWLRPALSASGLAITSDTDVAAHKDVETGVAVPAAREVKAEAGPRDQDDHITFLVYDSADMDGYTYFTSSSVFSSN